MNADTVTDGLTMDDLDLLIEAVESWESKDATNEIMDALVTSLLVKKDDPSYDKVMAEQAERKDIAAVEKRRRKERSVLLRAKLIGLLDSARANRLISEASS